MKTAEPPIPFLEPISTEMEQVEQLVHETLAKAEAPLGPILQRHVGGGKHLRSALVILGGRLLGAPPKPIVSLAAGLDLLHAATLIHDDLVDRSNLRRGRETLHTVWSVGATVLAGDYLLGQAVSLIAGLGHPRVLAAFGALLRTICAGEIRQTLIARDRHSSREDYYHSIGAKTASLFAASLEMAAILAAAPELQVAALRHFGHEVGIAYQIVDDVLDLTGEEVQLGKPAGSDLRQGLVTLPVLCYLQRTRDDPTIEDVLSGRCDEEQLRAAIEAIRSSGAIEASLDEAYAHLRSGQQALQDLPDSPARQMLCDLAQYVVERRR